MEDSGSAVKSAPKTVSTTPSPYHRQHLKRVQYARRSSPPSLRVLQTHTRHTGPRRTRTPHIGVDRAVDPLERLKYERLVSILQTSSAELPDRTDKPKTQRQRHQDGHKPSSLPAQRYSASPLTNVHMPDKRDPYSHHVPTHASQCQYATHSTQRCCHRTPSTTPQASQLRHPRTSHLRNRARRAIRLPGHSAETTGRLGSTRKERPLEPKNESRTSPKSARPPTLQRNAAACSWNFSVFSMPLKQTDAGTASQSGATVSP